MKTKERQRVDKAVGERLSAARELRGIHQEDLAQAMGVNRQQISKYESGQNSMSSERLIDAAEALDCSVMFLLSTINPQAGREYKLIARLRSFPASVQTRFLRSVDDFISKVSK